MGHELCLAMGLGTLAQHNPGWNWLCPCHAGQHVGLSCGPLIVLGLGGLAHYASVLSIINLL